MKKPRVWVLTILCLILAIFKTLKTTSENKSADQMNPSEIYARCYAKLLRKPVPLNDSQLLSLKSGSFDQAESACEALLNRSRLDQNGNLLTPNDPISREVLNTMVLVHNSWFANQSITLLDSANESKLVLDADEPALYWTQSLLQDQISADSVVTADYSLKSKRIRQDDGGLSHFQARTFFAYDKNIASVNNRDPLFRLAYMNDIKKPRNDGANYSFLDIPNESISEFGAVIGIQKQPALKVGRLILPALNDKVIHNQLRDPNSGPNREVNLHAHFGGGIIGSIVYGLKNSNMNVSGLANSYSLIDRRFAARLLQDLLCYQLPVLTMDDVQTISGTAYPFHKNKACMQCHATMDELAMLNKNFVWAPGSTAPSQFDAAKEKPLGARVVTRFQLPQVNNSNVFALQAPNALFRIRTFGGNEIKVPVSNFKELGQQIAALDDFYTCAAKRYYYYFTGIDIPLQAQPANAQEQIHFEKVLALGKKLKSEKNLKNIILEIFKSPTFQSRNYLTNEREH
jgi:hypothetical protein